MATQPKDTGSSPSKQPAVETASLDSDSASTKEKKSWYRRYIDAKSGRNVQLDEADLKKYTGMSKAELDQWGQNRAGVGGNQAAGKLASGPATGLGGTEAAHGFGGWGSSNENVKFPPQSGGERKANDGKE